MSSQDKQKKKCEITVECEPVDVNIKTDNEASAQYMANTKKGFNDSLKKALAKKGL